LVPSQRQPKGTTNRWGLSANQKAEAKKVILEAVGDGVGRHCSTMPQFVHDLVTPASRRKYWHTSALRRVLKSHKHQPCLEEIITELIEEDKLRKTQAGFVRGTAALAAV
jgi:hypothetical protein